MCCSNWNSHIVKDWGNGMALWRWSLAVLMSFYTSLSLADGYSYKCVMEGVIPYFGSAIEACVDGAKWINAEYGNNFEGCRIGPYSYPNHVNTFTSEAYDCIYTNHDRVPDLGCGDDRATSNWRVTCIRTMCSVNQEPGGMSCQTKCAPGQQRDASGLCYGPSPNLGNPPCNGSNPINEAQGNKFQQETDYRFGQDGLLEITRYYNSDSASPASAFGLNWRGTYSRSIQLAQGNTRAMVYRPDGKVEEFTLTAGVWQGHGYSKSRLEALADGWRYTANNIQERYDTSGRLTRLVLPNGRFANLAYDTQGRLLTVTDYAGRTLGFSYATSGRVIAITRPDGLILAYDYSLYGNILNITLKDTNGIAYSYISYSYGKTDFPNLLTSRNDGYTTTWDYDSQGRGLYSQRGSGDTAEKYSFAYQPDLTGQPYLTTITDPLGTARGYRTTVVDGVYRRAGISQPGGAGCGPAGSEILYDGQGNISRQTAFDGQVTTYTYDLDRNLETQRVEGAGTPLARTVSTRWHGTWRYPVAVAEPGKITTYVYHGDLIAGTPVSCAPADALAEGTPIGVLCRRTEQATDDPSGSQGFAATPQGNARTWQYQYDRYGHALSTDGPRTDVADITTYTYWPEDASCPGASLGAGRDKGCRGQLQQITDPVGLVTQFSQYSGNGQVETWQGPDGQPVTQTYDPGQHLLTRAKAGETNTYTYDAAGLLRTVRNPDGSLLTLGYDSAKRLITQTDGLYQSLKYTLDAAGNRVGADTTNSSGTTVESKTWVMDALGRPQAFYGVGQ